MRILPILALLLILPLAYSLEECKRVQETDGIPCRVTTTWQPPNACNTYDVQIFNDHGLLIENLTLGTFGNSGFCQFNFTQTSLGSYPYNITNGDTGNVNVIPVQETKMLSVIIGFVFIIAVLIWMGIIGQNVVMKFLPFSLALMEFIMLVFIILAQQSNSDITTLLTVNFYSILIAGGFIGLVNLWRYVNSMADVSQTPEEDESKWGDNGKWGR